MLLNITVLFFFTLICMISDIREKRIYTDTIIIALFMGVCLYVATGILSCNEIIGGMIVGVVLYVISIISHESLGRGDALIFIISGLYLGTFGNIILLSISMFFAGLGGIIAFLGFSVQKDLELPFAPFITVGTVCLLLPYIF